MEKHNKIIDAEKSQIKNFESSDEIFASIGNISMYMTEDGKTRIECQFQDESIWLSQALLCELYQVSKKTISEHIRNILKEEELEEDAVVRNFRTTAADGKNYSVNYYNLDMILAVGYRVRNQRGTAFRKWATDKLSEYMLKGFVMDDERLKNPSIERDATPDYFDEMLERIRDIRSSEKRVYLRVKEIYALAGDYNPKENYTIQFFKLIQNKLHYAATGFTAAELIYNRAADNKVNMGLTTWRGDEIRKSDVTIAKNYLQEKEIQELNRIVSMWLDYAEDQARRKRQVFLREWEERLDAFLKFNERNVLDNSGEISKAEADTKALEAYDIYSIKRREEKERQGEYDLLEDAEKILMKRKK